MRASAGVLSGDGALSSDALPTRYDRPLESLTASSAVRKLSEIGKYRSNYLLRPATINRPLAYFSLDSLIHQRHNSRIISTCLFRRLRALMAAKPLNTRPEKTPMMTPSKTVIVDIVGSLTGPVYHVEAKQAQGWKLTSPAVPTALTFSHPSSYRPTQGLPTAFRWRETRPTASSPGRAAKTWATATDNRSPCDFRMRSASLFAFELIGSPG